MNRKYLLLAMLLPIVVLAQGGGQPVNIPIPITSFSGAYGSIFSQDLGVSPLQLQAYPDNPNYVYEGVYTLTLTATNDPASQNYPGYFVAKLSFGTQELCSPDGWGKRTDTQVTFVCAVSGYLLVDQSLDCDQNPCVAGDPGSAQANSKQNLFLAVTVNGWTVNFKNAKLTFTPVN